MKIAFASGKGGTGKSTVSRLFADYKAQQENKKVVLVDADVEEPNQLLFFDAITTHTPVEVCLPIPIIDADRCTQCGACVKFCNYTALSRNKHGITVYPELCHGCGGCTILCPVDAITEKNYKIGETHIAENENITLIQGKLSIGSSHATPLIRELIKRTPPAHTVIIDSPPGAACSFVAVAEKSDAIVLVAEPTPFGLSNLQTVIEVCEEMEKPFGVIINRCDMGDNCVEDFCRKSDIPVIAHIPYHREIAASEHPISTFKEIYHEHSQDLKNISEAIDQWELV